MARSLQLVTLVLCVPWCLAQPSRPTRASLPPLLNFEADQPGKFPAGWGGAPADTIFVEHETVHGGKYAVRLERTAASAGEFTSLTLAVPIDFAGKTIEFRGFARTEAVSNSIGLWLREDRGTGPVAFQSTQGQQVKGTTDWKEYSVQLPVAEDAETLYFGFLLAGTGKAWGDDFALLVDGKPIWEAPARVRPKTVLDTDTEFDEGSRVTAAALSPVQIANLATLGKVWGFLKYHHPAVTSGTRHWDYDLFRILPEILAAPDRDAANRVMLRWVAALGGVEPCKNCARLEERDLHLRPELKWIPDEAVLGPGLSRSLREIYANRSAEGRQFYVSMRPYVGNPQFEHELSYAAIRLPDTGFQILALFRFWNMAEYWFPYRDMLGEDWDAALARMLPRVALAGDRTAYQREMMALIALLHDTHANLWSSLNVRPPVGACALPVAVRFLGGSAVVWDVLQDGAQFRKGDALRALDGASVAALVESWQPYYAASNDPTRLRDIGRFMTRGACGETRVKLLRESKEVEIDAARVPENSLPQRTTHDQPGDTFRLIGDDVAYIKLSSIADADLPRYIESASKTKGLIVDIRNYPKEFVMFTLAGMMVGRSTEFAVFTGGDPANPGAFRFRPGDPIAPKTPHYAGKVVVLVDEVTQSSAEYTAMALRAAGAKVIGSTTAGADGNVSEIPLPGGLRSMFSGIGVFYPDRRPTQRAGIVPDIEVVPSIAGIREGRDELFDAAVREIRGR